MHDNHDIYISVVVPLYNMRETVIACLESVNRQITDSIECIVIDDGSTDGSGDAVRRYKYSADGQDLRPWLILHEQPNGGSSAARNKGMSLARGKYVSFIDPDDLFLPDGLQLLAAAARENNEPDMVIGGAIFKKSRRKNKLESGTALVIDQPDVLKSLLGWDVNGMVWGVPWAKLIKTETARKVSGGMRVGMVKHEDTDFILRMIPYVQRIVTVSQPVYLYDMTRSSSTTVYKGEDQLRATKQLFDTQRRIIQKMMRGDEATRYLKLTDTELALRTVGTIYVIYRTKHINRLKSLKEVCRFTDRLLPGWMDKIKKGNPKILISLIKISPRVANIVMNAIAVFPNLKRRLRG